MSKSEGGGFKPVPQAQVASDSGIGRSIAVLFAREGSDVTIVYLPEEEQDANDAKKMVEKEGRKCLLVAGDLMDNKTCLQAVDKHVKEFGVIHTLVNNASKQIMCTDLAEIDLNDVESAFRSNILQMFVIKKYALPHMQRGGSYVATMPNPSLKPSADVGRHHSIINTTSTVAFRGTAAMVDYSATTGAITSFTRSLAKQLLPKGIRVNAVAPGPVHTPLQPASRPPEQMEGFGKKSQLGRPGQPSEIAPSFIFLASKDSELYHGQILHAYPLGD
ncbi:general stress protein [Beauveria brongniartii RCEF 3172]|uniref:General stress protein n=1 Tax=Beauveria brongniartii RCEF 3172 TaxID=1081107 RepID=A0A166XU62_9HYPO|nr:general stress protein [Beauveria brongniartii RCEF 3172]